MLTGPKVNEAFQRDGYTILRGVIRLDLINEVEEAILSLYQMQACKIGEHQDCGNWPMEVEDAADRMQRLCYILDKMEAGDKEALYQVQKMIPQSLTIRELYAGTPVRNMAYDLLADHLGGFDPDLLLLEGPGLFINRRDERRLHYKWHTEQHYYPKRRNFINVWLPLFSSRTQENGAMSMLPGSHGREWQFAEYQGFNKDTQNKAHHFVQYEVPERELSAFLPDVVYADTQPGDVVLFHRNLVHRSNLNICGQYAFAAVARLWTPIEDLTLAGNAAVTPYGGDPGGRPDLVGRVAYE